MDAVGGGGAAQRQGDLSGGEAVEVGVGVERVVGPAGDPGLQEGRPADVGSAHAPVGAGGEAVDAEVWVLGPFGRN